MLTTFNEIDMTAVSELRERRKEAFKERYGVSWAIVVLRQGDDWRAQVPAAPERRNPGRRDDPEALL